jgi:acyl-coenzyme A thioesterase PaaI-like protein
MSRPEHGGTSGRPDPDGLTVAWLGLEDLGPQPGFSALIDALRTLQDAVTGARPPAAALEETTRQVAELTRQLAKYQVDEREQIAGHLAETPGRGQALIPPVHLDEIAPGAIRGHVTFGRFYLGGNGAVHGGAIPLVFDDLMGRLANTGRSPARTAYLHVNYRNVTPIETRLTIEARLESVAGRKRLLRGELRHGGTVCAEAESLFVALRPGQP